MKNINNRKLNVSICSISANVTNEIEFEATQELHVDWN